MTRIVTGSGVRNRFVLFGECECAIGLFGRDISYELLARHELHWDLSQNRSPKPYPTVGISTAIPPINLCYSLTPTTASHAPQLHHHKSFFLWKNLRRYNSWKPADATHTASEKMLNHATLLLVSSAAHRQRNRQGQAAIRHQGVSGRTAYLILHQHHPCKAV
jgi:hypothetical protein